MGLKLMPASSIKMNLGIEPNGRVQKFFTNTCYNHMDKYVPMDTGDLRTIVDVGTNHITYNVPYAHAQYIGIVNGGQVKNYTTAGTGPYWDERMISAEKEQVISEVQKYAGGRR